MNTRGFSSLIMILVLALLLGGGYYYFSQKPALNPQTTSKDNDLSWNEKTTVFGLSTTTIPVFTNYHDSAVLKKLNAVIDKIATDNTCIANQADLKDLIAHRTEYTRDPIGYTSKQLEALSPAEIMNLFSLSSETDVKVIYNKHDILSLTIYNETYCGGAHGSHDTAAMTFDLKTGEEVQFENLFSNYEKNHDALTRIFIKEFNAELLKEDSNQSSTLPYSGPDSDCPEPDASFFAYPTYAVNDSGIVLYTDLPYAIQACGAEVPVPVKELKPFLAPNSILNRL